MSILACKDKKSSNVDKVSSATQPNDLFKAYNPLKLPFSITDTNMAQLQNTDTISYSLFTQSVPDTIFNTPFGKSRKLSIYPIGKIEQKGKENYYATFVKDKNRSAVYLSVFDKNKFVTDLPLVTSNEDDVVNTASIDKKLSIVINKQWTVKNVMFYKRTIYAYNNSGIFTTVLTETNEDRSASAGILNQFDTLPKRNKFSGDYTKGKKNVLYIRDTKTPGQYLFFVHFESESKDEPCGGELRGYLKMTSDKAATYSVSGDQCVINFSFKGSQVKVTENGTCGNYRGIKCFFNDTYTKKKEAKTVLKRK
jgi:uncharacterized protein YxeA